MRALTIWQPWAHAIIRGNKRVENRSWPPPANVIGERIAIHVGRMWDSAEVLAIAHEILDEGLVLTDGPRLLLRELKAECGHVIGSAIVSAALPPGNSEDDPWRVPGEWGWKLADVRSCAPMAVSGQRGLWTLPYDVAEHVVRSVP